MFYLSIAFAFLLELEFSHSFSRQSVFRDILNSIDIYSDTEFIARYSLYLAKMFDHFLSTSS